MVKAIFTKNTHRTFRLSTKYVGWTLGTASRKVMAYLHRWHQTSKGNHPDLYLTDTGSKTARKWRWHRTI